MFLLGIDIAKLNHVASCIDSSTNEIVFSNFKFKNDFKGFSTLLDKIKTFDTKNLIIGLESTSHYGENLINFLFKQHFKVALINPLQTSHLRKANIRDAKNDNLDSLNIAKSLIFAKLNFISEKNINCFSLKKLTRFRSSLIKQRSKAKIQLTSLLDLLFPELQYLFKSKIHSKAIYSLLKKYPSTEEIAALKDDEISNLLYASSKGHFKKEKSIELKSLAKTTVGIKDTSISLHVIQLIELIELYDKQIKDIVTKIADTVDKLDTKLLSVPGISIIACAIILGETNNFNNFSDSTKLLAFAGLDPKIRQSGNFNASSCRMSKKGSPYLRYALIFTAWNIVRHSEKFNKYYCLKRSQGKSHYNSLGHVAHKLVRVIFTLIKKNIVYQEENLE
ncbi:IS110 family transposase ISFnu4 [Fusobacterium nucleatum subsp. nucleatum ATCC 25586]|uniref:Transposase n=4 Tax=Fusobacterium nucleatum subsp. nucleatum (strain ATCC 25586 / DSM 15643 / BCRC 10681 / CIP 101130 / JCM 8532 / KCTC 2640 / LMG 13131 / VPI 4355) TaxID=190304 RepID=Q8R6J4_FUSNN|nr:IS110-like element ISFnu4 family transposase [Fusobacterium nucleatum]AAL93982.1 Transposase [Fusobacterium nucleatum subsp. nucleatum ATCC 25586]AAL95553.1 Transposase [Fusobacterium nucleatum subsp. nucleatum ATCC 25586]AVQ14596.1 IS110 family transposase ISFnu4 [Fusobacterium nucleatum subsp. nucleatum ATCC 25586]AVQ14955.1 IS110 family transposase ISFnu4 [Fusobacterium nucleatum subsp. nucleatum ATCC 25586]AVQ15664.1 IS110 family transposase ISFnu4 [Fusobacterium nucleatum subsp. nuclea